jgi:hypothetical protein
MTAMITSFAAGGYKDVIQIVESKCRQMIRDDKLVRSFKGAA